jgi:hypothetical protein
MAAPETSLPYGVRDIKVATLTSAGVKGTPVALPNAQTLEFTEGTNTQVLRGDDRVVAQRISLGDVEWTLAAGGINFAAAVIMFGGGITESGTTPAEKVAYTRNDQDVRPDFYLTGRALSESGGDFHLVFYRAKAAEMSGTMQDQEFWVTNANGTAIGSLATGKEGDVYDMVVNETPVATA